MNPAAGAEVCRMHGGGAPQVVAAAERRNELAIAERAVATYGGPVDVDPGEALLQEVRRTAGHVQWIGAQLHDLSPEALVWGRTQAQRQRGKAVEGRVDLTTITRSAAVHTWLELYLRERKHLREVCRDALAAGVAERQVRLAEQAGERAGQWLRATLQVLDLTDEQMRQVLDAGVRHLHLLEAS